MSTGSYGVLLAIIEDIHSYPEDVYGSDAILLLSLARWLLSTAYLIDGPTREPPSKPHMLSILDDLHFILEHIRQFLLERLHDVFIDTGPRNRVLQANPLASLYPGRVKARLNDTPVC